MNLEMLKSRFKNPPAEYRGAPFWSWNDRLEADELRRQIDLMKEAGWGGFFMHSRVGLVTPYLGDEWMAMIRACAEHAEKLGMKAWLYDEDKWPSGFAGGIVPRLGERVRQRFLVCRVNEEPAAGAGAAGDCVAKADFEGKRLRFFVHTSPLGDDWFNGTTYPDMSNPETTRAFLDSTHEPYKELCNSWLGGTVPGVFTDEPAWGHFVGAPQGALPWTADFPRRFLERKGYSILDHLAALYFPAEGYRKVRFDFFDAMLDCFIEGFSRPYGKWCEENGLLLTGHYMWEDDLARQTAWIGAAMPHYEYMQWPGVDHLGRQTAQTLTQKQAASAASQLGKERVLCETFGTSGQNMSLEDQKWIVDFHIAMGINFINPHLSLYTMRGERKRDYPPNVFFQQPWWKYYRGLADYYARLSMVMSQGRRVAPVLLMHPISSAWAEYNPTATNTWKPQNAEVDRLNEAFNRVIEWLLARHIDFELGDEILMARHGGVEGGRLRVGRQEYSLVIFPVGHNWRRSTIDLMESFLNAGGNVVRVGDERWLIDGEPDFAAEVVRRRMTQVRRSRYEFLCAVERFIARDLRIGDAKTGECVPKMLFHHRRIDGADVFFFANNDRKATRDATIELNGLYTPVRWNTETGEREPIAFEHRKGKTLVCHEFTPVGSLLLVCEDGAAAANAPQPPVVLTVEKPVEEIELPACWKIERLDPNALTLDFCQFWSNGLDWTERGTIWDAYIRLRNRTKPGDKFEVEFEFRISSPRKSLGAIDLVCETPHRFEIRVNDRLVDASRARGAWIDASFRRFDIKSLVRRGDNRVCLSGVWDESDEKMELECFYVVGDFGVFKNADGRFALRKEKATVKGRDLVEEGFAFYPGSVRLRQTFDCAWAPGAERRAMLEFEWLDAIHARLWLNGVELAPFAWRPWERDVTSLLRAGANTLEIELTTSLFNLLGPHHSRLGEITWVSPSCWTDKSAWTDDYFHVPVGVAKPRIAIYEEIRLPDQQSQIPEIR